MLGSKLRIWWLCGLGLVGCNRNKYDATFPEPGTAEQLSVQWEGAEVAGSHPSFIVDSDDIWHLYLTATEGSYVGPVHATATDGVNFTLSSSSRLLTGAVEGEQTVIDSVRVWSSGSTWHMLANTTVDGASAVAYARAGDEVNFALVDVPFQADVSPASGEPLHYSAASADYEPGASSVYLDVEVSVTDEDSGCYLSTTEDGGATWSTPERLFGPADVPEPWSSRTVGPGGMWDYAVVPSILGGYHMLFVGAAAGQSEGAGIGHAFSEDGLVWTLDNEAWRLDDVGEDVHGLFLKDEEDGYWLYYSSAAEGGALPEDASLYRMWLGLVE